MNSEASEQLLTQTKISKTTLNFAKSEPLTPYNEEFIISHVTDGEDILIGRSFSNGNLYLNADFSNFSEKLKVVTPEKLEEYYKQYKGLIEKVAPEIDEETQKLLHACWRATRIVRNLLGNVGSEYQRNESFDKYKSTTVDGKSACIKPLSHCHGESVCAEYSLLTHHVLELLNIPSSIVIGAFSEDLQNKDSIADRHTFLVLENGKYIFDPTHTAQQKESWPPKVFSPEKPFTAESLKRLPKENNHHYVCTDLLSGEKLIYGSGAV